MTPDDIDRADPHWDALWTLLGGYLYESFDHDDAWTPSGPSGRRTRRPWSTPRPSRPAENTWSGDEFQRATARLGLGGYFPPADGWRHRDWLTQLAAVPRGR